MSEFTHIDPKGRVRMVDITDKPASQRMAKARASIRMQAATLQQILDRKIKKGNVLETARIAGIMAAKKTADLIPMCHPLNLSHVSVDFYPDAGGSVIGIEATARLVGQTGVEMEALTAAAVASLTVYDMCKSTDREMAITEIRLVEKTGGKSGHYRFPES
ncbi:MAG: molybdenum cofactor biosynthesis protein MoaC [Deltaproteobacteria bacterium SG8_13]|nr:MAG: molybdenum cofactor biosynthesis protein MoaC [Deltaproteobacteria bacterium SG8_13]